MSVDKQISNVREIVKNYLEINAERAGIELLILNPESKDHIINIGTSVLCAQWDVGYPPGGFVQAVIDNDLSGTFARADHINREAVYFYVMMLRNIDRPQNI